MHDRELYRQILGVQPPWDVTAVEVHLPDDWYKAQPAATLNGLSTVAMDMWSAYIRSTIAHVPDASSKIAFDKFHVVKHLGDAVDRVRRAEHKALKAETGDSPLTSSRYLWLQHPDRMTDKAWAYIAPSQ